MRLLLQEDLHTHLDRSISCPELASDLCSFQSEPSVEGSLVGFVHLKYEPSACHGDMQRLRTASGNQLSFHQVGPRN